ncbi:PREDICTED: cytochrome c oxidase assembly factor 5 isoform X2 [Lupinus angustifolius]|nr:PREDICTED: cytochrome c oxidase assembly factor 5 isoform X2 [Lupinus angustifolius]
MSKSCKGLALELVKCLSESDCVKVENRSIRDCAGEKSPSIPSDCVGLRETYFNCKRGQVDMRARIRGNKGYLELHILIWTIEYLNAPILGKFCS